ncbi:hypothetical protein [Pseudonocardia acaciae]|uniref:hypothetical protein n=1 Tax=Pseudonocardia acaciae TaxID=551276 RepID=UPI000AC6A205|nr:hypothetical protein [Pseudonocardia acaciae]
MLGYVIASGVLVIALLVALAVMADRGAQAAAWKRIAEERRWNHDRLKSAGRRAR